MRFGGIVLCGGRSTRMGKPKEWLAFGDEVLLARVVRLMRSEVDPVVVVAAHDQALPALPGDVAIHFDRRAGRGPLEGIFVGLSALCGQVDAAFVCGCDAALLSPALVRRMCELLGENDAAVPVVGGYRQPLGSVCRTSIIPQIEAMLAEGDRRTHRLFDRVATRFIAEDELRRADPELLSLRPMNTVAEYQAALAAAGMAAADPTILGGFFPRAL